MLRTLEIRAEKLRECNQQSYLLANLARVKSIVQRSIIRTLFGILLLILTTGEGTDERLQADNPFQMPLVFVHLP